MTLPPPEFVIDATVDDPELSMLDYAEGSGSSDPEATMYAMKSAAGWKKK